MKRIVLTTFAVLGMLFSSSAQSLVLEAYDEVVEINSSAVADYSAHATIKNMSSDNLDVMCKRQIFGSNWCAFDSAYFCWDLCYPSYIDQSIGTVAIASGESNSTWFSGHVYSTNSGASCIDSIRYTFYKDSDPNDSVSFTAKYSANAVFSVEEKTLEISEMYPNPAATFVVIELTSKADKGASVEMFNLLGAKVREAAVVNGRVELNVSDLHAGIYLVTINKDGKAVETRKVVVRH